LYEFYDALSILLNVSYVDMVGIYQDVFGYLNASFEACEHFFGKASMHYVELVLAVVSPEEEKGELDEYQYKLAKAYKEFLGLSYKLYEKVKKEIEKRTEKFF